MSVLRCRVTGVLVVLLVIGGVGQAWAQTPSLVAALTSVAKDRLQTVLAAAEQMPESGYAFSPAPGTRTFAALVAHVADTNRAFCSAIAGAREPVGFEIEKAANAKTAVVEHLKTSMELCTRALDTLTDAVLPAPRAFGGGTLIDGTRIAVRDVPAGLLVTLLTSHTEREYGKLTVYLRSQGLVPPTSLPRPR